MTQTKGIVASILSSLPADVTQKIKADIKMRLERAQFEVQELQEAYLTLSDEPQKSRKTIRESEIVERAIRKPNSRKPSSRITKGGKKTKVRIGLSDSIVRALKEADKPLTTAEVAERVRKDFGVGKNGNNYRKMLSSISSLLGQYSKEGHRNHLFERIQNDSQQWIYSVRNGH